MFRCLEQIPLNSWITCNTHSRSLKKRTILLFTLQEICLSDPPVVMTLVDGPTGDSDNMICVAYRHQFDLVNESTGESYRLHHVETNRVSFHH